MENKRDFKGIWIPAEIWLNEDLNATEKMIIAEVHSLSNQERGCFASNAHFGKITGLSNSRCSAIINKLKETGILKIEYIYKKDKPKEIEKRIMKIDFTYSISEIPLSDSKGAPFENKDTPLSDMKEPPFEYSEDKVPVLNYQLESTTTKDDNRNKNAEEIYKPEALRFYEQNGFGTLSSVVIDSITEWMKDFEKIGATKQESDLIIIEALKVSVLANKRYMKYTNGTLRNWHNAGLYTVDMIAAAEKEREESITQSKAPWKPISKTESIPDWFNEENKGEEIDPVKEAEFAERRRKIRARKNQV